MTETSILWRRLDTPGHDACRLEVQDNGWELIGTAVSLENGVPAQFRYQVFCDHAWRTQKGLVYGWLGTKTLEYIIARTSEGAWTLNGVAVPGLEKDAPAAWLDASAAILQVLPKRYERRAEGKYWYEAPKFNYAALLEVGQTGFILRYPGLWEAEL